MAPAPGNRARARAQEGKAVGGRLRRGPRGPKAPDFTPQGAARRDQSHERPAVTQSATAAVSLAAVTTRTLKRPLKEGGIGCGLKKFLLGPGKGPVLC